MVLTTFQMVCPRPSNKRLLRQQWSRPVLWEWVRWSALRCSIGPDSQARVYLLSLACTSHSQTVSWMRKNMHCWFFAQLHCHFCFVFVLLYLTIGSRGTIAHLEIEMPYFKTHGYPYTCHSLGPCQHIQTYNCACDV